MQATELARRMVTEWGMSEKLGPLRYNDNQQEVFLGHAITQRQHMSEETARLIDEEVRRIVTAGERKAREVLTANRDKLETITQALMEYETVSGEEVNALMRGEKIVRTSDDEDTRSPAGPAVPAAGKSRPPRPEPGRGGLEPFPQT
jgi:cell division protease FtsH